MNIAVIVFFLCLRDLRGFLYLDVYLQKGNGDLERENSEKTGVEGWKQVSWSSLRGSRIISPGGYRKERVGVSFTCGISISGLQFSC